MDRYQVSIDKKSGITNNPNDWCDEIGNPRYIVDLIKRIVAVSLTTMQIIDTLPKFEEK
jgi:predicted helicase